MGISKTPGTFIILTLYDFGNDLSALESKP